MADPADLLGTFITATAQNLDKAQTKKLAGAALGAGATILLSHAKKLRQANGAEKQESKEKEVKSVREAQAPAKVPAEPKPHDAPQDREEVLLATAEEMEDELLRIGDEMGALRKQMFTARAAMRKLDADVRGAHLRFCTLNDRLEAVQTKLDNV